MRREAGTWLAGAVLLAGLLCLLIAYGGILYKKEQDDRFCVSCHLHEEKFVRFQARPSATDLVGAHHVSRQAVRCIDCHGGADFRMRLRVWGVALADTVRFLAGRYQEPIKMRLPFRNAECQQCHDPIIRMTLEEEAATEGRGDSYHAIAEHRTVRTACIACHTSHTPGEKRLQFIDRKLVLPLCRACHETIGEEVSG